MLKHTGWDTLLRDRSYVAGFTPSQADVQLYKAMGSPPAASEFPHLSRWFQHVASFEGEFASLKNEGDKELSAYLPLDDQGGFKTGDRAAGSKGVEASNVEEEVDLFASDGEEEDLEALKVREARLMEYEARKASKVKPAAKTAVTLDIKTWGQYELPYHHLPSVC